MKIGPLVLKLRLSNTYFSNRVGGAAELDLALAGTLQQDMAFIIPLAEDAKENTNDPTVIQTITERFGVVCAVANDTDPEDLVGLTAYDRLHDIRSEIFKAFIGWDMGYDGVITFRGGRLLGIDSSYLWYQYEFEYLSRLRADIGGYGEIVTTGYYQEGDPRKYPEQIDNFLKIYAEFVMTPSLKWNEIEEILKMEGNHLPISSVIAPDMSTLVDMTNQYIGGWDDWGFGTGFDFYRENK